MSRKVAKSHQRHAMGGVLMQSLPKEKIVALRNYVSEGAG